MTVLDPLLPLATEIVDCCTRLQLKIVTAESCTGGLVAAMLTEVAGSSAVVDRGLVTYSNAAKTDLLGVPAAMIEYPPAEEMIFKGEVVLMARFSTRPTDVVRLTLVYQACDDRSCLPAVSRQIDVALP